MNYKTKACECLEKGDYKGYYDNALKYHSAENTDDSLEEFQKAKKKLELYREIQEFTKKEKACYYEVLGLKTTATSKQIREAYTKLMNKFHPDRTKIKESNAVSRIIQKAYSVLSDPDKRAEYDHKSRSLYYKRGDNFVFSMSNNFDENFFDFHQRTYSRPSNIFSDDFEELLMSNNRFFDAHFGGTMYNNLLRNLNRRHTFRRVNRVPPRDQVYYKIMIFVIFMIILLFFS